jgi:hypothetical protein
MSYTTLRVKESTRDKVMKYKNPRETVDDLLNRTFPATDEVTKLEALKLKMQQDAQKRVYDDYLEKIREKNLENEAAAEAAAELLGLDIEEGKTSGFWAKDKFNKKE